MQETSASLNIIALALAAYLIGSVPVGAIVAKLYGNVDLTQVGSQRTGATNVSRSVGPVAGAAVLLGDMAKGALAVWLAVQLIGSPLSLGVAWLFSVIGHTRSVFLKGRGGRGVGIGLGGLCVLSTGVFCLAALTGAIISVATRYVSLGSIAGSLMTALAGTVAYRTGILAPELFPFMIAIPAVIILAHVDNIARLRAGTERRLGERASFSG